MINDEEQNKIGHQYFTETDLIAAVGTDGFQQMQEITINPGNSFLNGESTNINTSINDKFNKTTKRISSTVNTLTDLGATGLGAYEMGKAIGDNYEEILTTLSMAIINKVTVSLTAAVTEIATGYLLKHTTAITSFPTNVASYTMSYFNSHKKSAAEVLQSLKESAEQKLEKEKDELNKRNKSEFISNTQKESKNFIDKINQYTEIGISYIGMITSYIQNGPNWVIDQTDKQIGKLLNTVNTEIDKQWAKDEKKYNTKAKQLGDKIGADMADKYNTALEKTQKKALEKIENTKTKGLVKVVSAKAKVASAVASLTGIYIPI